MRAQARPAIHTFSPECIGDGVALATVGNSAWPTANDAVFIPMTLWRPAFTRRLFTGNGNVASGNLDVGIYTADGGRIVSIGSTAMAGATALQFFDIADTYLSPGRYFLALAANNTSAAVRRMTITVIRQQHMGIMKMASAFPLPATATLATTNFGFIPLFGMELMGLT